MDKVNDDGFYRGPKETMKTYYSRILLVREIPGWDRTDVGVARQHDSTQCMGRTGGFGDHITMTFSVNTGVLSSLFG